jgi:hypothetical protein
VLAWIPNSITFIKSGDMRRACSAVLVATLVQQMLVVQVFRLDQHRPIRHILGSARGMKVADAYGAG